VAPVLFDANAGALNSGVARAKRRERRWGQGLTAEKMPECRWLRHVLLADFEFVEFTPDGHLRHAALVQLKDHTS